MSHADGKAILPNGDFYWFEYDGTSDICCTRLYSNYEDLHENWRKDNMMDCSCSQKEFKKVILSSDYGCEWDFLWKSEICEKCMCITGKIYEDYKNNSSCTLYE